MWLLTAWLPMQRIFRFDEFVETVRSLKQQPEMVRFGLNSRGEMTALSASVSQEVSSGALHDRARPDCG